MDNPELAAWIEMAYPKLLVYAKYQTFGDVERAEELLQTTLQKVIEGRVKLDIHRSPFTVMQWAMRTTSREIRQGNGGYQVYCLECDSIIGQVNKTPEMAAQCARKHFNKTEHREWRIDTVEFMTIVPYAPSDPRMDIIEAQLERLVETQQEVVHRRLAGETYQQIADILGVTVQAVQDCYQKAVVRLRKLVKAHDPGGSTDDRARL